MPNCTRDPTEVGDPRWSTVSTYFPLPQKPFLSPFVSTNGYSEQARIRLSLRHADRLRRGSLLAKMLGRHNRIRSMKYLPVPALKISPAAVLFRVIGVRMISVFAYSVTMTFRCQFFSTGQLADKILWLVNQNG
jgi:hypothetical protein